MFFLLITGLFFMLGNHLTRLDGF
ncbi:hypothetical protein LINPERHAP1_LOCUS14572 [Linum perenne]